MLSFLSAQTLTTIALTNKTLWCTGTAIPFSTIHEPQLGFKAQKRQVFIPGQDILVRITGYERSVTTHLLNPNLYVSFMSKWLI